MIFKKKPRSFDAMIIEVRFSKAEPPDEGGVVGRAVIRVGGDRLAEARRLGFNRDDAAYRAVSAAFSMLL